MAEAGDSSPKDAATDEEYASLSKLLLEFTSIPTIDQAWAFKSQTDDASHAMFLINQPNLSSNSKRKSILSSHIQRKSNGAITFESSPFPIEMMVVSLIAPSPSGSKLLVIRNSETDTPTRFEIWSPFGITKEFNVPCSIHGSVYSDGWFEGISWNSDETMVAYVAEEPEPSKPAFVTSYGYKRESCKESKDTDCNTWNGQGNWEEDWGEAYAGNRQPSLFVINICSGKVYPIKELGRQLTVGQVVWAPPIRGEQYLVFVGWPSNNTRKFGIKYCTNRPCSLYAIKSPQFVSETGLSWSEDFEMVNLTQTISSALFPRFSPVGKFLVFLSTACSVDSGSHQATDSLRKIDWPSDEKLGSSLQIIDLVPVVMCPDDDHFPGLYCKKILTQPWLSDGDTMVLSSVWGCTETIVSVNVLSGKVSRISPKNSYSSWEVLALDGDNIIAVCSSPVDIPEIKYGVHFQENLADAEWNWLDAYKLATKCSETASSLLVSLQFDILKIPVNDASENLTQGSRKAFEAIHVSSKKPELDDPLIVVLHGGPHDVSTTSFSKSSAFLSSIGYSLLIVNYRGSRGFGEEALQSLPGKVGSQDVNDVITAINYVIDEGLANPSKIAVVGISHGGFLTTHLIGQAPEKISAAAARNPVCNLALMVGTTDIPDWCFFEAYGKEARFEFTESPSAEHLAVLYSRSPISHVSKVKTPTLMLLGAKDVRVPIYDGMQYARALKEKGVETKVILFPHDIHEINRPQSDFESFLNIGLWFNKYCKYK